MLTQHTQSKNDDGLSPVVVGAVGLATGLAAGAATIVLADQKNRKKLREATHKMVSMKDDVAQRIKHDSTKLRAKSSKVMKKAKKMA